MVLHVIMFASVVTWRGWVGGCLSDEYFKTVHYVFPTSLGYRDIYLSEKMCLGLLPVNRAANEDLLQTFNNNVCRFNWNAWNALLWWRQFLNRPLYSSVFVYVFPSQNPLQWICALCTMSVTSTHSTGTVSRVSVTAQQKLHADRRVCMQRGGLLWPRAGGRVVRFWLCWCGR